MKRILRFGLVVGVVSGAAVSANAILIDDFTQGPDSLRLNTTGFIEGQQDGTNIPGMQRDVLLTATANPFSQPLILNITGSSSLGATFYNGGVGTEGSVQFDYDGFDVEGNDGIQTAGPGMGPMNLSTEGAFTFTFLNADGPVRIDVTAVTYGAVTRTSVGSFTTAGSITSPTTITVPFTSLNGMGGGQQFNPGSTDRLTFRFTPTNPSGDFALGQIATSPVPEPASMAVLAAGLFGMLRLRRRRR